jgi:ABC-type nitrate/sulfonate/bicarbonate transport system substrate-binding protein
MTRSNRASLSVLLILSAACVMPLAFAQQTPPPTSETGAQPQQSTDAATPAAAPAKKTWSELDVDKNGSLNKDEASSIPSLQAVFDQADSNADGALTGEEYKTWLASNGKGQPKSDTQR